MNATSNYVEWLFHNKQSDIYQELLRKLGTGLGYNPWIGSILGSVLVGLSGVFPLLVIPVGGSINFHDGAGSDRLKLLLSFAVGGLLGDVFLHLLPEAWSYQVKGTEDEPTVQNGMWILCGLLLFTIVEKILSCTKSYMDSEESDKKPALINNNVDTKPAKGSSSKQVSGYLNLIANVLDNYTHGLAVGGSFLLSGWQGVLTTSAILIHEIPHEVGDFAILLRSGFTRIDAAKAQLATASSSLVGACTAVYFSGAKDSIEAHTSWILPFTVGGFLNISLVTVLPELLQEKNPWESIKQLFCLLAGISIMAILTSVVEE